VNVNKSRSCCDKVSPVNVIPPGTGSAGSRAVVAAVLLGADDDDEEAETSIGTLRSASARRSCGLCTAARSSGARCCWPSPSAYSSPVNHHTTEFSSHYNLLRPFLTLSTTDVV